MPGTSTEEIQAQRPVDIPPYQKQASYSIFAPALAKWWGSDGRALGQAFRGLGHAVLDIDAEDYLPWRPQGVGSKAIRRMFSRLWINDYNQSIMEQARSAAYDFVLVFKGNWIKAETLRQLRSFGKPIYNFYPDVSFEDHGENIPACLPLYNCVFTTKTFHGDREIKKFGIRALQRVRHGFDPEVHRPMTLSEETLTHYGCDVSFVGCWSAEKERRLLFLTQRAPQISLKVYGLGWNKASSEFKKRLGSNLRGGVFGDELSIVYCASKINLGLLSSNRNSDTRDQTTARTFQIPATGSFMLHEDTPEVRSYFQPGKEVALFDSDESLVESVTSSLQSAELRAEIAAGGLARCRREGYDYVPAATKISQYFSQQQ